MQNLLYQTWRKRDRYQRYLWVNIPFVATYIFKILRKWKLRLRYTTAQLITISPMFSADYAHRFPPTVRCNPSCYRAKIPEQYFLQSIHLFLSFCHRTVIGHSTIATKRAINNRSSCNKHHIMGAYTVTMCVTYMATTMGMYILLVEAIKSKPIDMFRKLRIKRLAYPVSCAQNVSDTKEKHQKKKENININAMRVSAA